MTFSFCFLDIPLLTDELVSSLIIIEKPEPNISVYPSFVFVGTTKGRIIGSSNCGKKWTVLEDGILTTDTIYEFKETEKTIEAYSRDGQILISYDYGNIWATKQRGDFDNFISELRRYIKRLEELEE